MAREHDDRPRDGVRERTRRHMVRWLASGAAGAVVACEQGPMVCDPLPPPLRCPAGDGGPAAVDWASHASVRAQWTAAGDISARVGLHDAELAFDGAPSLIGASLLNHQFAARTLELTLRPDAQAAAVDLTVPARCKGAPALVRARLDVSGARTGAVPATTLL